MNSALRPGVAAGVTLVAAGMIGATGLPTPDTGTHLPGIALTAGSAQDIVIDFVRHGETDPPGSVIEVGSNGLPGFPLGPAGQQEAVDVGNDLFGRLGPHVAGIFGGYEQRMAETAAPFVGLEDQPMQTLNGFDEIGGGIFADDPPSSPGGLLSEVLGFLWVFGADFLPLTGSNDYNGVQFDENFSQAVATAYADALANPVLSANGHITDVVFSGEGAIVAWTLMNVQNPDLSILIPDALKAVFNGNLLGTAGQVVVQGSPTDGWTLESFDGQAIPAQADAVTEAFVYLRNALLAPQIASSNLFEALLTGSPSTIESTLQGGSRVIGEALAGQPLTDFVSFTIGDGATGHAAADALGDTLASAG